EGRAVIPRIGACNTAIGWWVNFKCSNGVTADFFGTPNGYSVISKMNNLASFEKKYRTVLTHGTAFEGADGWILVDRSGLRSYPEDLANTRIKEGESKLMRSYNHARNLLDGVKSRNNTVCNIDAAVQADEMCHISDITTRLNRKVVWNPKTERFVNDEQANSLLSLRKMRYPWQL
ncbi:MAG: hypothetical protein K9N52_11090, partial [Verrucomicrobia bacterium]|nr:hypothetical protein [Verrucomicrobiota bacterium]